MTLYSPFRFGLLGAVLIALSACTTPGPGEVSSTGVFDPYEKGNRNVHAFNRGVDRAIFRPTARGFTRIVPDPIEDSFVNFSQNLSEPGDTVNFLLQGRLPEAGRSFGRFLFNSTFGLLGLLDPATEIGLSEADTNFGETLHVWGAQEGAYVELPFFGPSTERDAVGVLVDFFTNPLSFTLQNPVENVGVYAEIVERLSQRGRFSDTIDSILYESADSYAQSRLIYLQARRFELGGEGADGYIDPYLDPYAELDGPGAADLSGQGTDIDPYEDLDAE